MEIVVTGGAGFVGSNLVARLLATGHHVRVFDNLSRPGTELNLRWLESLAGTLTVIRGDIRNANELIPAIEGCDAVFHLAAQVAVTTSVTQPLEDFHINLTGTVNLLECVRQRAPQATIVFTSTNKVYGRMDDVLVIEKDGRYLFRDLPFGISEDRPLDFYSPYGCSKGGADQYIHDYARIYGLRTVVVRMSCIYGDHQMGNEDQGWVAHFLIQAARHGQVTIFGDGKQVRDILYVQDLADLFIHILQHIELANGQVFNVGGGANNTLSLLELLDIIENSLHAKLTYDFSDWRPGDQKVYISDIRKLERVLGWKPTFTVEEGITRLYGWIHDHLSMLP